MYIKIKTWPHKNLFCLLSFFCPSLSPVVMGASEPTQQACPWYSSKVLVAILYEININTSPYTYIYVHGLWVSKGKMKCIRLLEQADDMFWMPEHLYNRLLPSFLPSTFLLGSTACPAAQAAYYHVFLTCLFA